MEPTPAEPVPPARGAGPWRTRILILIAVAVVLAAAASVWAFDRNRGPAPPGPSASGLRQAWTAGAANVDAGPAGVWVTGRDAVVNVGNGAVAYNLGTGRIDWRWQPPAGRSFDNMSPTADLGVAVVAFGTGASPSANPVGTATASPSAESGVGSGIAASATETAAALNLATGRLVWSTPLAHPIGWPGPVLGDGEAAVLEQSASGGFGALDVLNLSTGTLAWSTASDAAIPAACVFTAAAITGGLVYGAAQCPPPAGSAASDPDAEVIYGFAPGTGAVQTQTAATGFLCADPDRSTYATLWADGGYVLVSCSGSTTTSEPLWIEAAGSGRLVPAAFTSQTDPLSYEFQNIEDPAFTVVGRVLYLQTSVPAAAGARPAVAALDLDTGKQLWQQLIPGGAGYLVGAGSTGATVALESGGTLSLAHFARSGGKIAYGPGTPFAATAGTRGTYRVLAAGSALLAILPGEQGRNVTEFRRTAAG